MVIQVNESAEICKGAWRGGWDGGLVEHLSFQGWGIKLSMNLSAESTPPSTSGLPDSDLSESIDTSCSSLLYLLAAFA